MNEACLNHNCRFVLPELQSSLDRCEAALAGASAVKDALLAQGWIMFDALDEIAQRLDCPEHIQEFARTAIRRAAEEAVT